MILHLMFSVFNPRVSSSSGSRNNHLSCPHPARYFVVIDNVNNMATKLELNLELGIEVPDDLKLKNECKSSSGNMNTTLILYIIDIMKM